MAIELANAWIALAGTMFGGAGFKVIEHVLGRSRLQDTTQSELRSELRTEVVALRGEAEKLRDEADDLRNEIDAWRDKYYTLVSSIAKGDLQQTFSALRAITEEDKK